MHNNLRKNGKNRDLDNLHISKYYGILLWCEGFLLCCDDVFRQREPSKKNTINEISWIKHGFLFLSTFALFILEGILIF